MRAGLLRHLINIENQSGSTPDGYGNAVLSWQILYADVPASVLPFSARETWVGQAEQSQTTHRVTMRYLESIDTKCRVILGTRVFDILGIANDQERNIMLTLDCKENFNADAAPVSTP